MYNNRFQPPFNFPTFPQQPSFPQLPSLPQQPGGSSPPTTQPGQSILNEFNSLNQLNTQDVLSYAQAKQQSTGTAFAVGCDFRFTIVVFRSGAVALMFITFANLNTTQGWIYRGPFSRPTFARFPTSSIFAYWC